MPIEQEDFLQNTRTSELPKRHLAVWIACGIIFLAVIGAAIWVWSRGPQTPLQPAGDQYEGWQTYTNQEFGFELKHPADAELLNNSNEFYFRLAGRERQYGGSVAIIFLQESEGKTLTALAADRAVPKASQGGLQWTEATFAARDAMSADLPPAAIGAGGRMYVFTHGGRPVLVVSSYYDDPSSKYLEDLTNKIFASVKFYDR